MNAVPRRCPVKFRLYVAEGAQNSVQAIGNLRAICRSELPGCHEIEVVDVFREPQRALKDGVLMTPTLIKLSPRPSLKIVGTLSQTRIVMDALGLGGGARP